MATRFTIGKQMQDGTVRSVYGHWDGYPAHAGYILQNHYTDDQKVNALLDLGDLSVIDKNIGEAHPFEDRPDGCCTFYNRDRGEDGVSALVHANVEEWLGFRRGSWCEYGYLRVNGEWQTFKITGEN